MTGFLLKLIVLTYDVFIGICDGVLFGIVLMAALKVAIAVVLCLNDVIG